MICCLQSSTLLLPPRPGLARSSPEEATPPSSLLTTSTSTWDSRLQGSKSKGMGTWLFLFFSDGADGMETCGWSCGDTKHWL